MINILHSGFGGPKNNNMPIIGTTDVTPKSTLNAIEKPQEQQKPSQASSKAKDPQWDLDSIVLSDITRQSVKDAIVFCNNREKIVNDWNLNRFMKGNGGITGINMYGKPGTGKSITAEAIAKATGKKIIKADYSQIQDSKWGGTEKQLTEIFETAQKENRTDITPEIAAGIDFVVIPKKTDVEPNFKEICKSLKYCVKRASEKLFQLRMKNNSPQPNAPVPPISAPEDPQSSEGAPS